MFVKFNKKLLLQCAFMFAIFSYSVKNKAKVNSLK